TAFSFCQGCVPPLQRTSFAAHAMEACALVLWFCFAFLCCGRHDLFSSQFTFGKLWSGTAKRQRPCFTKVFVQHPSLGGRSLVTDHTSSASKDVVLTLTEGTCADRGDDPGPRSQSEQWPDERYCAK